MPPPLRIDAGHSGARELAPKHRLDGTSFVAKPEAPVEGLVPLSACPLEFVTPTMHSSSEALRQSETRTRSCAALVLRFHAELRDPLPLPRSAPAPKPILASAPTVATAALDEDLGEPSPLGSALAVLKWLAIGAAILAPWALLLSG